MQKNSIRVCNRNHDITIEEVKALESFRDWDEEGIKELIRVIKNFTHIAYNIYADSQKIGKVFALHIDNQLNIAA